MGDIVFFLFDKSLDLILFGSNLWYDFMHSEHYDIIAGSLTSLLIVYSCFRFVKFWTSSYHGNYYKSGAHEQYFENCLSPIQPADRDWVTYNIHVKESLERRFDCIPKEDITLYLQSTYDKYSYNQKEEEARYEYLDSVNIPYINPTQIDSTTENFLQKKEYVINEFIENRLNSKFQHYIEYFDFKGWDLILKAEDFTNNGEWTYFMLISIYLAFYLFIYLFLTVFIKKWSYWIKPFSFITMFSYVWNSNLLISFAEAKPAQINFQDPATPLAEGIIDIHHHIFFFLILVFIAVSWVLYKIVITFWSKLDNKMIFLLSHLRVTHHTLLEVVWTIVPTIILYFIAVPSFYLLYSIDEILDPSITLKAVGHQWYWSYEYSDYKIDFDNINYDSYMLPEDELVLGQLRLLEVDNPVVLPINTHVRLLVTAADVLHCWAVPSLGVKIDAVPGRLNQASIYLKRLGTFYGQCSEICGVNHGFMPIVVKSVRLENYISWIINKIN